MIRKDIYISKELVANEELSELDLELKDKFEFNWNSNDGWYEIDVIRNKELRTGYYVNTTPLEILDLEKLIERFKNNGATHIQMKHHTDHHGYEFSGFKIGLADDELISSYNKENIKKVKLIKEYTKLQSQMNNIKNQLDELKI